MFFGTHRPRLDDKGRLFLPAKFREALAEGLVMTKGQERCIDVFITSDFEERGARLAEAPRNQKQVRYYQRRFWSEADHTVPDRQGRVTISPSLRAYAGLERDCAVVGVGTRIEIWDGERRRR